MKTRRIVALVLAAAGCFGLGLGVARWLGVAGSTTGAAGSDEPRIYLDAGVIELYDGSLKLDPLEPPDAAVP